MVIIGLVASVDENKNNALKNTYVHAINSVGGCAILLPYTDNFMARDKQIEVCDGVVFIGGGDIDPAVYGQKTLEKCGKPSLYRDEFELYVLKKSIENNKPVLGICRGAQLINVGLGGTLIQDIPSLVNTTIQHNQIEPKTDLSHWVEIEKDSTLYKIVKTKNFRVNSFHHQAIDKVGSDLKIVARSCDGVIEAVESRNLKIYAYQWHPELLVDVDEKHKQIFSEFIKICKRKQCL